MKEFMVVTFYRNITGAVFFKTFDEAQNYYMDFVLALKATAEIYQREDDQYKLIYK